MGTEKSYFLTVDLPGASQNIEYDQISQVRTLAVMHIIRNEREGSGDVSTGG